MCCVCETLCAFEIAAPIVLQQTRKIGLIADVFYLNVLETCRLERNVVSCNIACVAIFDRIYDLSKRDFDIR